MSKRIRSTTKENGTVVTRTTGAPEGELPSFDVSIETKPRHYKEATKMKINLEGLTLNLTGRQFRTLAKVCRLQEDVIDDRDWDWQRWF